MISSLALQLITVISGLILPRLIVSTFGSDVNGLVSSITQFLSFISLLEGGLGAVVLAELYEPIKNHDEIKIRSILNECQSFFSKLAIVFGIYSIILAFIYPLIIHVEFSYIYTSSMVIILSITTLIRYLFSITNKLFLQADQKLYLVNIVSCITTVSNLIIVFIILKVFPEIHVIKLVADILFIIQPIAYNRFIDKKYHVHFQLSKSSNTVLKNRWSGFAQNLAHFINMNTDVTVISIILSLAEVSVYSIYMLAVNALRNIISIMSNSYQSTLGKYYAEKNIDKLNNAFLKFERINFAISLVAFNTCLLLINPFVSLYTDGVKDANYYQPMFAFIIVVANLVYCIREPYRYIILAAGKFKETNNGAIIEAVLNILISVVLVYNFGLVGIAVGTLVAIFYRLVYFIVFLRRNIINYSVRDHISMYLVFLLVLIANSYLYFSIDFAISSPILFVGYGVIVVLCESIVVALLMFIMLRLLKLRNK